jgi:hypothetical protein
MEMEDTEEEEVFVMDDVPSDEAMADLDYGFSSITVEGLFRAGTPTPVITPPFPQITVPAITPAHETTSHTPAEEQLPQTTAVFVSDNLFDVEYFDEEGGNIEDFLAQEIPTDQLDQECIFTK